MRKPLRWLAAAIILAMGATSCAQIPQSSPVRTISVSGDSSESQTRFKIAGPKENASATEIAEGFLQAQKGIQDSLATARDFISSQGAEGWKPEQRTTIFASFPKISPTEDPLKVKLQFQPVATVDAYGRRTNTPNAEPRTLTLDLVEENGQKRILNPPDEVLLSTSDVSILMEPRNLYFYNQERTRAVPDMRWFVRGTAMATDVVHALLQGQSSYLAVSTRSAVQQLKLNNASVPVLDKAAVVDVTSASWNRLTPVQKAEAKQQLELSLLGLKDVSQVQVQVDSRPVEESAYAVEDFTPTSTNPTVGEIQAGVQNGQIVQYDATGVRALEDFPRTQGYAPSKLAFSYSRRQAAFTNSTATQLLTAAIGQDVTLLDSGKGFTTPSFDGNGWVWTSKEGSPVVSETGKKSDATAKGAHSSVIRAFSSSGSDTVGVTVSAPWLSGYTVKEVRVARDGVRMAVVASRDGANFLFLTAIIRSQSHTPTSLSTPVAVPLDQKRAFNSVRWVDDSTMVIAQLGAKGETAPAFVSQGGLLEEMAPLTGAVAISVGNAKDEVFLIADKIVYTRVGNAWYASDEKLTSLGFSG